MGDSGGGGNVEPDSVIRDSENVKSRDWARLFNERGCFVTCSFSLASRRESDPRLIASCVCLERWGIPVPYIRKKKHVRR